MVTYVDEKVLEEFNRTNNDRMIFYQFPEEMLDPTTTNSMFYPIVIFYSIVFFVGLFGNIFAITIMAGDRKSRNATNMFLVSLAVADMLLCGVCSPLETFSYFVLRWDEEGYLCRAAKFTELLSASSSVLNLIAVSFERYVVIVYPMKSRSLCTISNCRLVIAVVWICSFLMSMPVTFTMGTYKMMYHNNVTAVVTYYCDELRGGLEIATYKIFILFLIPGVLMMFSYVSVIQVLWKSARTMNILTNDSITTRVVASDSPVKKKGIRGMLSRLYRWCIRKGSHEIEEEIGVEDASPEVATTQGLAPRGNLDETELDRGATGNNRRRKIVATVDVCHQAESRQAETEETRLVQRRRNGERRAEERRVDVEAFNEITPAPEESPVAHNDIDLEAEETNDEEDERENPGMGETHRLMRRNRGLNAEGIQSQGQMIVAIEDDGQRPGPSTASTLVPKPKKTKTRAKARVKVKATSRNNDIQQGRKQVIKMLILVVLIFMVSWGPKLIMSLLQKVLSQELGIYTPGMYKLRVMVNLVPFGHSCINPLIYSFMSKRFRDALKRQINRVCKIFGYCPFESPVPPQPVRVYRSTRNVQPPVQAPAVVQQVLDLVTNHSEVEVPRV